MSPKPNCCQKSIEKYQENNSKLAVNLNEARKELRAANDQLIRVNREFHQKCDENSQLKVNISHMEKQLIAWKAQIADVVKNNTRGLNQLVGILGIHATPAVGTNGNAPNVAAVTNPEPKNVVKKVFPSDIAPAESVPDREVKVRTDSDEIAIDNRHEQPDSPQSDNNRERVFTVVVQDRQRRRSICSENNNRQNVLPNVTEEITKKSPKRKRASSESSISSESDSSSMSSSESLSPSPPPSDPSPPILLSTSVQTPTRTSKGYLRRSDSCDSPSLTPPPLSASHENDELRRSRRSSSVDSNSSFHLPVTKSPIRNIAKKTNASVKTVKAAAKGREKENKDTDGDVQAKGRPRRKAAPNDLKENKLNVKMRRK